MKELRGLIKINIDRINTPVKKWGVSSLFIAGSMSFILIFGIIIGWMIGLYAIPFILTLFIAFVKFCQWNIKEIKEGNDNPFNDRMDYLGVPRRIKENINWLEILKEKHERRKGSF